MKLTDVVHFLNLLGAGDIKISTDGEWARCRCPLAPFTHFKGKDEHPSFGVKANDTGESGFKCFTCSEGRLFDLIHIMNFTTGIPNRAVKFYGQAEIFDDSQITGEVEDTAYHDIYASQFLSQSKVPVPKEVIDLFPLLSETEFTEQKAEVENYFLSRGIVPSALYEYKVRFDPLRYWIVFPIHDTDGEVYRLHVRPLRYKTFFYITPSLLERPDLPMWGRKDYWFGIQYYDPTSPVTLVESETDVLRLRSMGVKNVIASCGPLNKFKTDRVSSPSIYLGFDSDEAGGKYTVKAIHLFSGRPMYRMHWNSVLVHNDRKELVPAKDAGDLEDYLQYLEVLSHNTQIGGAIQRSKPYQDVWNG